MCYNIGTTWPYNILGIYKKFLQGQSPFLYVYKLTMHEEVKFIFFLFKNNWNMVFLLMLDLFWTKVGLL